MYVVQCSPYSKLFMRKYQGMCETNPEFVKESNDFEVIIPRSSGAIILTHNKPLHISKLLPKQPNRKQDAFSTGELEMLIEWLTGGTDGQRSPETDIYGVVQLNVDLDVGPSMVDLALLGDKPSKELKDKALRETQDLYKDVVAKAKKAMEEATALANKRVERAIMTTHRNLLKSYETLKTDGKGIYTPSITEAVGAFILQDVLSRKGEGRRKMIEMFKHAVESTSAV